MRAWLGLFVAAFMAVCAGAAAHEVRPALLQVTQSAPDRYEILWKRPILGDVALSLRPTLAAGWLDTPPQDRFAGSGFLVTTWSVRSGTPLDGQEVAVEGLTESLTDVLLQVTTLDGRRFDAVLTPGQPRLRLALSQPKAPHAPAYLRLGVRHILGGVDHLMFVAGLLLLIGPNLRLFKAVTAFTVAHSVTLAAASLGWVTAPSAVVEALVALSIVFVAVELARGPDADTLTRRHPWIVAFAFGLLHGFAFAGALTEIGLPPHDAAPALFLFNVGVEIGQLLFVGVCAALLWALARAQAVSGLRAPRLARLAPAYAIGSFAAFWFLERLGAAFA